MFLAIKISNNFFFHFSRYFPHIPYVASKNEFRAKIKFRLTRGVAVGFWTKFEAQPAQPC
jgi:hypothetical protein